MNDDRRPVFASEGDAEAWVARARSTLDESVRDLDAATRSRLNRARHAALKSARSGRRSLPLWPAALATAFGLVLAVLLVRTPEPALSAPPVAAEDFAVIAGQDSLELYEDLEFYAWLDAHQADG